MNQWYASDSGNRNLQFVFQEFQKVARSGQVEMSRDTQSHDLSMSFTVACSGNKWEVKFPANFPHEGALLIETSTSGSNQREHRQPNSDHLKNAVKRMIRLIQANRTSEVKPAIPPFGKYSTHQSVTPCFGFNLNASLNVSDPVISRASPQYTIFINGHPTTFCLVKFSKIRVL